MIHNQYRSYGRAKDIASEKMEGILPTHGVTMERSYATEDGTLIFNGWKTIDGKPYYFCWEGAVYPYDPLWIKVVGSIRKIGVYLSPNGYAQGWQL